MVFYIVLASALALILTGWYLNVLNTLYLLLNGYVTDNRIGHGTENGRWMVPNYWLCNKIYITYYVTFMVWTIVSTIILAMVMTIWKCLKYKLYNIFYNMAVLWVITYDINYNTDCSTAYDGRTQRKGFQLAQISNRPVLNLISHRINLIKRVQVRKSEFIDLID